MRYLIVLLAIIAMACGSSKRGLRIRFDTGLPWNMGRTYFYDIPLELSGVEKLGWTKQPRADDHLPSLQLYCPPGDLTFGALFDDTNFIAGIQVAVPQDKFTGATFDWKIQGFTEWEPAGDGKRYWTTQQYFVNEQYLGFEKETRIISRNPKKTLQTDGIWVRGHHGKLLKISTTKEGIDKSEFTKQACIPWMGTHYYYNMTSTTECTSEGVLPWFPLVSGGELVGTGVMTFGKLSTEKGQRDWFERPNKIAVKAIVPRGPPCLYELPNNPGLVTMHIYYIDDPRFLLCLL